MVPISLEVFLGTLEDFNRMIRPMQALAAAFGLVALWVLMKPQQLTGRLLGVILASSWAATGLFYHLSTFAELNFWDYPMGWIFIGQALLLLWVGSIANRFRAATFAGPGGAIGLALSFYALAGPLFVGLLLGRTWAEVGYFAISPGSTILFTLGILLMLDPKGLTVTWIIPLLMAIPVSILGTSLGIWEDAAVLPIAIAALALRYTTKLNPRPS